MGPVVDCWRVVVPEDSVGWHSVSIVSVQFLGGRYLFLADKAEAGIFCGSVKSAYLVELKY